MPRKQRFKPSRKPKPSPLNEDLQSSRPMSNPQSNKESGDAPSVRDDESDIEPQHAPRSR